MADVVVDGDTLALHNIAVYGREPGNLTGLTSYANAARYEIVTEAKKWGFNRLRVTGERVQGSSSRNPGHSFDITINLKK
jgi:hypothetical protein